MELSIDNNLSEQKKKMSDPLMRTEYPDVDEDPDKDKSLMPYTDSRHAVRFKTCGANRDAQEKEENLDETLKKKMRRKLLSFVCRY